MAGELLEETSLTTFDLPEEYMKAPTGVWKALAEILAVDETLRVLDVTRFELEETLRVLDEIRRVLEDDTFRVLLEVTLRVLVEILADDLVELTGLKLEVDLTEVTGLEDVLMLLDDLTVDETLMVLDGLRVDETLMVLDDLTVDETLMVLDGLRVDETLMEVVDLIELDDDNLLEETGTVELPGSDVRVTGSPGSSVIKVNEGAGSSVVDVRSGGVVEVDVSISELEGMSLEVVSTIEEVDVSSTVDVEDSSWDDVVGSVLVDS